MDYTEIVKKLIGNIRPVGESTEDRRRLENLKSMCKLVQDLVTEIDSVGYDFKDTAEHSLKQASNHASNFLTKTLGIEE